jgi:hypothetical protein
MPLPSLVSMLNVAVCGWLSQVTGLRWLSNHAEEIFDELSFSRRGSFLPLLTCLAEIHRVWPALQL